MLGRFAELRTPMAQRKLVSQVHLLVKIKQGVGGYLIERYLLIYSENKMNAVHE